MNRINWPALIRAGQRDLRLSPESFWSLTPAELMTMLGLCGDAAPLTRAGLDRLIAAFPDADEGAGDG